MNNLIKIEPLTNRYFIMRHGRSLANQLELIVSSPENGVESYGLDDKGREQVIDSVEATKAILDVSLIISSDFKRAQETAEITHDLLSLNEDIVFHKLLRERFFGDLELTSSDNYQSVWDEDGLDATHTKFGVESAEAVMDRATSLIATLEGYFTETSFLLVSHGDVSQILQAAFNKLPASEHRSVPHLNTAEIRELIVTQ
jgi:probable phosphoglycerate mutase